MAVKRFAKLAGIAYADGLTFHNLRGIVASLATSDTGVALQDVAGLLGHKL